MAAAPSSSSSSIHHHHRLFLPQLLSTTSSSPLIPVLSQISPAPKSLRRCFRFAGAKHRLLQQQQANYYSHYNFMPSTTTLSGPGSTSSSCCNPKSCSWKSKSSVIDVPAAAAAAANCRSADDDGEVTTMMMMIRKLKQIQKMMPDLALGLMSSLILTAMDQQPALANIVIRADDDWTSGWITAGVLAFVYLFVMPPIIFTWLRLRWYKRKLPEMYLQFMFVFLFYPSVLLWAPFLNFRMMPTDPTMKYPWSTPSQASSLDRYVLMIFRSSCL